MNYRKTLYQNYSSTQSLRRSTDSDIKSLFNREKTQFEKEILPLLKSIDKSSSIFDMGCGSGSLIKALQENGFNNVLGMDISPEQIEVAKKMDVSNVTLGNAIEYVGDTSSKYDVILGMDIIEHFTKDELVELLINIKNKLNPNGFAVFRTPNLDSFMASVYANGDFTHENYLNASSAQQVCLACGFTEVEIKSSVMSTTNPLKEIIRRYLWFVFKIDYKLRLFASGRSTQNIVLTPNMLIVSKI